MTDTIIVEVTIATIINRPVKETGAGCAGGGGEGIGDSAGGVGVGAVGVTSTALFSHVIAKREKPSVFAEK